MTSWNSVEPTPLKNPKSEESDNNDLSKKEKVEKLWDKYDKEAAGNVDKEAAMKLIK